MAAVAATLLIAIGLPTTLIDDFNAQDIGNREMGPGFRWTIMLTPEEQEAYRWIRTQTPPKAIVADGPDRSWTRNVEPATDVRLATHGRGETDLADGDS